MYRAPLQPISNAQVYVSGDVTIEEGTAVAPGAILQADPDSRIIIAPGVCIGMGAILHARQGTLEVEAGAVLGAGVLVIGAGKIGANACIGSGVTLLNPAVKQHQALPAGALIGDTSRQIGVTPEDSTPPASPEPTPPPAVPPPTPEPVPEAVTETPPTPDSPDSPTILYGQSHIHQLLVTLFPHRKSLNQPDSNGQSPSGGST